MPEINYIKHLRENEDLSLSEIARKTGKDWRTIKKYADGDVPTVKIGIRKSGMMVEDGYGEIVDDWLEEDFKLKKKERRTNKVIFEQLQKEHGFPGSYRTVCEYIQHQKPHIKELKEYNAETRELAIKNWGKDNLHKGGKPVMDCINSELKEVEDLSLISYVSETILKDEIRSLYESFCKQDLERKVSDQDENDTYQNTECDEVDDTFMRQNTIRGQKEKENEKEKEKQEQKAFNPNIENNPDIVDPSKNQKTKDVKEIVAFWDNNGFGFSNVNAKQQLL